MEAEVQERLSAEVESLKIQMQMLESELDISRMRADSAEEELRQLKATLRKSGANIISQMDCAPAIITDEEQQKPAQPPPPPPPPAPPMPANFGIFNPTLQRSRSNSDTLFDAIGEAQQRLHQTCTEPRKKGATGRNEIMEFH